MRKGIKSITKRAIGVLKKKVKKKAVKKATPKKVVKKAVSKKATAKKTATKKPKIVITKKMLAIAKKQGGLSLTRRLKQTGKSVASKDGGRHKKALSPGLRLSRNGNIYYESRKNRSDAKLVKKKWL